MSLEAFRSRLETERRRLSQPDYLGAEKRSQERDRRKRRASGLPPRKTQSSLESLLREHEKKHAPVPFTPDDIPDWLPEGWESTRRPADSDFDYVAEWFRNEIVLYESSAPDDEVITGGKDVYPAVADAYRLVGVFQLKSPNTEPIHRTWQTFDVSEKGRKTALSELKNAWAWILNVSIYLVSIDMADLAAPLPGSETHSDSPKLKDAESAHKSESDAPPTDKKSNGRGRPRKSKYRKFYELHKNMRAENSEISNEEILKKYKQKHGAQIRKGDLPVIDLKNIPKIMYDRKRPKK